jgi:uncharacterized protein (DUF1778 family)
VTDTAAAPIDNRPAPLAVRVPAGMKDRIDRAANRRGMSRNAFMVKALERVLAGEPEEDLTP